MVLNGKRLEFRYVKVAERKSEHLFGYVCRRGETLSSKAIFEICANGIRRGLLNTLNLTVLGFIDYQ